MVGVTAYGAYVPRRRLSRMSVVQSMGWLAPALMTAAQGERSMCNWDEDSLTMAVASARDCLTGLDKKAVDGAYLASMSFPFRERQNCGIMAAAVNLPEEGLATADFTSCTKCGTTAVMAALDAASGGDKSNVLVTASDARPTKAAWFHQLWYGDAAASLLVGKENVIAEFKGAYSVSCDFVSSYRGADAKFEYGWEERWIRDEGFSKILPEAQQGLLQKCGVSADEISKVAYPCFLSPRAHASLARSMGISPEQVVDGLHGVLGDSGSAHPLILFISALEEAKPGDKIVMMSFGQGCDALLFEVTDAIKNLPARQGVKGSLAARKEESNYSKFLKWQDLINVEMGIRAEAPKHTALSALWRNRKMVLGLVGGKCKACGTPQMPRQRMCVNPKCNAVDSQEDYEFADKPGVIKSYTGDLLVVSVDPPAVYGLVEFNEGGRSLFDFTDCELGEVKVGQPVTMSFRAKYYDDVRDFRGYYWKAVPQA